MSNHDIVQVKNPRTNRYIKINRTLGLILGCKYSKGPYKNIPIVKQDSPSQPNNLPD